MEDISIRAEIPAPPQAVWDVLSDHRGMTRWAGVKEVVLRQEGQPAPNGLGAIRVIRSTGVVVEEEVTVFEPPMLLGYQMAPSMIFSDYQAEIRLETCPKGTSVDWSVRLRARIPGTGWLLRTATERTLTEMLSRLEKYPFGI